MRRNSWSNLIGFGGPFITNPDLPFCLRLGLSLTPNDRTIILAATPPATPLFLRANIAGGRPLESAALA